ncbi:PAS domain-containing sensor histidine kinase [Citricoccus sp. SGAir0253]|uniref:sensor histidine kinase n=1 Tax=Citricoccus sp. SGAir0253 TaxID=2567881 RepID=UPI0010CD4089|nr:ATP-binding protein [Citricoccus sp. SGAir0253]QCU77599.1 PAS domain-containing sensor histidine kinase [Citricoccus sp. SGAir0253]
MPGRSQVPLPDGAGPVAPGPESILDRLPDPPQGPTAAPGDSVPGGGEVYFGALSLRLRVVLSQLPLTLSVMVVALFLLVLPTEVGRIDSHALSLGLGGVLGLTALAAAVPWDRLPTVAYWSIPLLDFVAIAPIWSSARHDLDGMSMLCAFPVFWLAWSGVYPCAGIGLGVLGSAAVTWWPYLTNLDQLTTGEVFRPTLVPLFMLALGVAASILSRSMDRQRDELEESLAEIRQQNRRLAAVLDATDVGILVTDRRGRGLLMNAAQRRQHLIGQPPGRHDAPERDLLAFEADGRTPIPVTERPVYRAVHGESFSGRLVALGPVGNQQFLSISAQAMRDERGAFDGTVVVFHNVTDLLDAVRSRERFMANVTHEFRTPLTSIIGFLDLAIEDEQDARLAGYLATCLRNAERLLDLVNTLLESASGDTSITPEDTDLVPLVAHSVDSAQVRAAHAGVALEARLPESLHARADRARMSQVADNLVSNALKYTEAGGSVTVTLREVGDRAELEVADTGIGMTPEELEQVFRDFYRSEYVRRAAIPGTGLGLALTRSFVRGHEGEITVRSEAGVGSVFTAWIPLAGPGGGAREDGGAEGRPRPADEGRRGA